MFEGVEFGKSFIKTVDFLLNMKYFTGAIKFAHLSQQNVFLAQHASPYAFYSLKVFEVHAIRRSLYNGYGHSKTEI